MPSRVCATGHSSKKSRSSCPGGRFLPSSIHQVIIITRQEGRIQDFAAGGGAGGGASICMYVC